MQPKNRVSELLVPIIEHNPSPPGEITKTCVPVAKPKPTQQYGQVNPKSSVAIPAAQTLDANLQLRHYLVILNESREQKELEIVNPHAKIIVPKGAWGYEIRTKRVSVKGGQVLLENYSSSKVYVGTEITKAGLEESIQIVTSQTQRLEIEKIRLQKMIQTMKENNLERIVEVGSGQKLKMIALSEYDKVIPPELYNNS